MRDTWVARLLVAAGFAAAALFTIGAPDAAAQTFQLGSCSATALAGAVSAADSNGQNDVIYLKQSCTYTLSSQLQVTADGGHTLRIWGYGNAVISGNDASRIFLVDSGANLTLLKLTLTHGGCNPACAGGAIDSEGGSVEVTGSAITSSSQNSGAIFSNGGSVTITSSMVTGSTGDGTVPAIRNTGGSTLTVSGSTVANNDGGGISNQNNSVAKIVTSTISGNTSAEPGGGIANTYTLRVYASTISGNTSNRFGGGIFNQGTAWVADSTIADNTGLEGGGLSGDAGQITVEWTTLSGNTATSSGTGGNVATRAARAVLLHATILANSSARGGDCSTNFHPVDANYNLADDATCALTLAHHSLNNTSAGLDPNGLQNNGGPTQTIALLSSSPAIDYIPTSVGPPNQDQRLFSRPDAGEGFTDIGAYEVQDS